MIESRGDTSGQQEAAEQSAGPKQAVFGCGVLREKAHPPDSMDWHNIVKPGSTGLGSANAKR